MASAADQELIAAEFKGRPDPPRHWSLRWLSEEWPIRSFRRSSTREVVDALLGIRCRDGIS